MIAFELTRDANLDIPKACRGALIAIHRPVPVGIFVHGGIALGLQRNRPGHYFAHLRSAHLGRLDARLAEIAQRLEHLQTSVGRVENRQLAGLSSSRLSDYEYRVFSQWGEENSNG